MEVRGRFNLKFYLWINFRRYSTGIWLYFKWIDCCKFIWLLFHIIQSDLFKVFQICNKHEQEKKVLFYILLFVGLGVLMLFTMFLQVNSWFIYQLKKIFLLKSFFFAISGEALTQRLRAKIFRTLLQQEVAYFDQPDNSTGALCTRLATEASAVQGVKKNLKIFLLWFNVIFFLQATGIRIGTMLQNFSNLGVGLLLAFYFGWSLTLLILAFIPFMIIAGYLQTYMMTGFADKVCRQKRKRRWIKMFWVFRTRVHWKMQERFEIEGKIISIEMSMNCIDCRWSNIEYSNCRTINQRTIF